MLARSDGPRSSHGTDVRPRRVGDAAPEGPIVGVRVEDELAKDVLCENEGPVVFTISHFRNFDAVLIDIEKIEEDLLEDLIAESWRVMAPPALTSD